MLFMWEKLTQMFRFLFIELEEEETELLNYRRSRFIIMDDELEFNV